jgi:hypothetical protein
MFARVGASRRPMGAATLILVTVTVVVGAETHRSGSTFIYGVFQSSASSRLRIRVDKLASLSKTKTSANSYPKIKD